MNKRLLALFLLSAVAALAQKADSADEQPQSEMPSNLTFETDLYFIEPKMTMAFGFRSLTGTKSAFRGNGSLTSSQNISGLNGVIRTYHDGYVAPDTRGSTVDNGDGTTSFVKISPDGKTDSWNFTSQLQATELADNIAFHTYAAEVLDSGPKDKNPGSTYGVEVTVNRDMGKLWRFNWSINGGLSVNDINSKLASQENANVTTITDYYALNGQAAPTAPYTSPDAGTSTTVTNDDGSTTTVTTFTSTLLPQDPTSSANTKSVLTVSNHFNLKGAYYTFRAGPTLSFSLTQKLRASFSAGPAVVYAGTDYSVQQDFLPPTGDLITLKEESHKTTFLPGYYVEGNLEYWLTDHAGLYLGAVYQNSGDFKQDLKTVQSNYTTTVDLSSLQGFRMGMNVKF